jgi:enoyl-CoA hydratase/carnithine racemase
VVVVRFTNPPRNFFDEQMSIELFNVVREIDKDDSIGAAVLTGKDLFVTHAEVRDLLRGARSAPFYLPYRLARIDVPLARLLERLRPFDWALRKTRFGGVLTPPRVNRAFRRMNKSSTVFIAAINGVALGMGAILALACDLRIMAEGDDAAFGLIESGASILAGLGGTQRLTRMVGQSRAADLLLDGRWLSAQEAAAIGLVNDVVPASDLQETALSLASRLAARSPVVNREIKRMVYDAATRPFGRATSMEYASFITTMTTRRAAEDLETYLGKLAQHDPPSDRDILDAWAAMLGSVPPGAEVPRRRSRVRTGTR